MRTEIPECRRCCMCLPLRFSLIVWGYFRVLLAGIILIAASYFLDEDINRPNVNLRTGNTSEIVMLSLLILVLIPDIIFGIVFIVGCHKKNAALVKKYYFHNIFLLALFIPLSLYDIGWTIDHILKIRISIAHMFLYSVLAVMTCLTYMVIQIYIVLLIRSEFIKLETNACRFRYDNGEAEAQCALNMESLEEGQEATGAIKGVHNYDKLTNVV